MANLQAIRKRISSVKNTQQLTRAMKMVAAARLRRVQDKVLQSRPFAEEILKMIQQILEKTDQPELLSPFLSKAAPHTHEKENSIRRVMVLVVGSDRGLCGAYNSNVQRKAVGVIQELLEKHVEVSIDVVGKRIYAYLKGTYPELTIGCQENFHSRFSRTTAVALMGHYRKQYLSRVFSEFCCVYTEFRSPISQKTKMITLMPVSSTLILESIKGMPHHLSNSKLPGEDDGLVSFEPAIHELAQHLVESFLDSRFYQLLLDAIASEHGARMTAMESATKNAKEMMSDLTLYYNQQRQAKITNELLDIVGGAEAMSK